MVTAVVEALPAAWRVLVVERNRICGEALQRAVQSVWPAARSRMAGNLADARRALKDEAVDLLLAGVDLPDGDALPLLAGTAEERGWRRALIVTGRKEGNILSLLRTTPVAGVFDPEAEPLAQLMAVLPAVMAGGGYWSASVMERLRRLAASSDYIFHRLTLVEMLVFAAVGDGSDDATAAARLGMKPSTVQSVRSCLHRKLAVQHRGELVRLAVQKGVVWISAEGVHRPGFERLLAIHGEKRRHLPEKMIGVADAG